MKAETSKNKKYDLVIALVPTRAILDERRCINSPPSNVKVINLRPRPEKKCGKNNDREWKKFETNGLGILGKKMICKNCSHYESCFWVKQYSKKNLKGARVIFGTQAHLERSPYFISQLIDVTEAENVLVIMDEINFITAPFKRFIKKEHIEMFTDILTDIDPELSEELKLLQCSSTKELRDQKLTFSKIYPEIAIKIQQAGYNKYGKKFKYLAYELYHFCYSRIESREKNQDGDIVFTVPPVFNTDLIIFSGTADPEFLKFRLALKNLPSPFENYRFKHPDSTFYNISSSRGTSTNFNGNEKQILDFFALLIIRRIEEGKIPLLISKKNKEPYNILDTCIKGLNKRFKEFGAEKLQVVLAEKFQETSNKILIPILTYGAIGINDFSNFDCAFCLNGFYISDDILNDTLQDLYASDYHVPIEIDYFGKPPKRKAAYINEDHEFVDVAVNAQRAFDELEINVVLQAISRVRPFTKPREIITFNRNIIPYIEFTKEFYSLQEAREYFDIKTGGKVSKQIKINRIQDLKMKGYLQTQVAEELGIGLRTVQSYWKSPAKIHL